LKSRAFGYFVYCDYCDLGDKIPENSPEDRHANPRTRRRIAMPTQVHEIATPTEADALLARESLDRLSHFLVAGQACLRIHIHGEKQPVEDITLPMPAFRLLNDILAEMAKGHGVALLPVRAELTTQQAADLLNVSRPYLIGLLEEGKIPFRLVGQHRRVRLDDLLAYQRKDDEARRRIADELTADAQELGMGY
jgi:excisionase family DNA binding protein